jgi:hypothetical protein
MIRIRELAVAEAKSPLVDTEVTIPGALRGFGVEGRGRTCGRGGFFGGGPCGL